MTKRLIKRVIHETIVEGGEVEAEEPNLRSHTHPGVEDEDEVDDRASRDESDESDDDESGDDNTGDDDEDDGDDDEDDGEEEADLEDDDDE